MKVPHKLVKFAHRHLRAILWILYSFAVLIFVFLLFLNFYPVKNLFENAILQSTKIYDRNGVLLYETLRPEQGRTTEVSLDQIPKYLTQATIAVEDKNFYENSGVDLGGITRAFFQNVKSRQIVSGGSTITQQLIRNVIGTNQKRTWFQKIKETLLALRVAKVFSKDEILRLYLNKIYYGNLNYGVAAASMGYFGKNVSSLDLAESAFLAGLPQAPNRYDPFKSREDALKRKDYVLSLMNKQGFISEEDLNEAKKEKLVFENNLITVRAPHFVNYVIGELEDRFGGDYVKAGMTVKTTLDYNLQLKAQDIVRRNLNLLAGRNVTNGSVVVLEPKTGDIIVMIGSADYFNKKIQGEVNIATQGRQPGSSMKPITYAVAFEKGWNGATLLKDRPVRFFTADGLPYVPKNYDYEYHGTVTVREALANSYNIPAVLAIDFASVESVLDRARELGLGTLDQPASHYGLALTLGDGEIRLLDLTSVYMTFANYGIKKAPQAISEIRDADGKVIYQNDDLQSGERVFDEAESFMVTDILADNGTRIPEFGLNNVLELSRPAAVKTGTTRDFRDNWTFGFTPDYVTGVWVGNSDNSPMYNISGIYGAGPIWHDVMEEIHRGLAKKEFVIPPSVEKREFCLDETQENGETCKKKVFEWVPKSHSQGTRIQAEPVKKLHISKPFDLDVFKWQPDVPQSTQQIKFQVEKDKSVGEVRWFVSGELVGKGDEIFWPLKKGNFEIKAEAQGKLFDTIQIAVE